MKDQHNSDMRMPMLQTEGHALLQLMNSKKVHTHIKGYREQTYNVHTCATADLMKDQLNWLMKMLVLQTKEHTTVQFMDGEKVQRKARLA